MTQLLDAFLQAGLNFNTQFVEIKNLSQFFNRKLLVLKLNSVSRVKVLHELCDFGCVVILEMLLYSLVEVWQELSKLRIYLRQLDIVLLGQFAEQIVILHPFDFGFFTARLETTDYISEVFYVLFVFHYASVQIANRVFDDLPVLVRQTRFLQSIVVLFVKELNV